jgi:hypothetical protein
LKFVDRFEIDIVTALSDQISAAFDSLTHEPLTEAAIATLERDQGVDQLFHQDVLVYVGKADTLPRRLAEHKRKISGRRSISVQDMGFKCLYVHKNWTTLAPEKSLIERYADRATGRCAWNGNGFGPHDPGRQRETSNKAPDGFDANYPIKEDWACEWVDARNWNCLELLISLKGELPYLLRYETAAREERSDHYSRGHPDFNDVTLAIPSSGMPAANLLGLIARTLPGWQATAFPSHLILYKEDRTYRHGTVLR